MTVLESPERAQERLLVKVQPRCSREHNILGVSVLRNDHQEQSRCWGGAGRGAGDKRCVLGMSDLEERGFTGPVDPGRVPDV